MNRPLLDGISVINSEKYASELLENVSLLLAVRQ